MMGKKEGKRVRGVKKKKEMRRKEVMGGEDGDEKE